MIYLITETEIWEDGHGEPHSWLSDQNESWEGKHSRITAQKVGVNDVTIEQIVSACERDLENGNYHDMMFLPEWLVKHLRAHLSDSEVKNILWAMIQDKGFLWVK